MQNKFISISSSEGSPRSQPRLEPSRSHPRVSAPAAPGQPERTPQRGRPSRLAPTISCVHAAAGPSDNQIANPWTQTFAIAQNIILSVLWCAVSLQRCYAPYLGGNEAACA